MENQNSVNLNSYLSDKLSNKAPLTTLNVFVSIYNPVDLFPPTINAVESLAKKYDTVTLLTNGIKNEHRWVFPKNVSVHYISNWPDLNAKTSLFNNVKRFVRFVKKFRKVIHSKNFDLVLLYESHAALAYNISVMRILKKNTHLWYHNHDICETSKLKKYFIGWWAARAEQNIFSRLTVFSLPANERKQYFPLDIFRGDYYFIPNYPSLEFYSHYYKVKNISTEVKLLYQGRICSGHGLEELIELLPEKIANKRLTLHVKGIGDITYLNKLKHLAVINGVEDQLFIYGLTSYSKVPELTATCHIGIGIQTQFEIMHTTLGTSSNKIYEYAATGMPVLLYENEHFREHLGKYEWTRFTNCSRASLILCIEDLIVNYNTMSVYAYKDFAEKLNFEKFFEPVRDCVLGGIKN